MNLKRNAFPFYPATALFIIRGLYYKTFYGCNCCHIAISQSVCHCHSLSPQSKFCKQGQEVNIRVQSHKVLHLDRLQPCPIYKTRVQVNGSGKHASLFQNGNNYDPKFFYSSGPRAKAKCYKSYCCSNLVTFHRITVILCYKTILRQYYHGMAVNYRIIIL